MTTKLDRSDFLENYWPGLYKPGHHVFLIGPTQRAGKTHLGFQLLGATDKSDLDTTVFCMKPRDRTVAGFSDELGFREIPSWPPKKHWWDEKPEGYTLWPRQSLKNVDKDNAHLREEFQKAMMHGYSHGNSILFLDEIYGIVAELGLGQEVISILTRGGGMKCGAWMATQKPGGTQGKSLPGFIFNCPTHMFLANDNDARNRQRYSELAGGHDPREIENTVLSLGKYEFLYLNADGSKAIISR